MQKQEFGASYAYPRREGSTHGIQVDVVRADSGMESRASATVAEFQIWSRFEARSDTSRFSVSPVGPAYIDDSLPSLLAWHATPNMTSVVIQPQHSKTHEPVLVHELVDALVTDQSGSYLDATFGRGGHARAILAQLSSNGRLIGFDRDLEATSTAQELEQTDSRFMFSRASFSQINSVLAAHHIQNLSGICLDVGVSSPQLMNPDRGFSFDRDGPLDMRMDTASGAPASLWLNKVPAEELAKVLRLYGDVRAAKSIARHIASRRPLETTFDLVAAIRAASGSSVRSVRILAQVFQAVRIYINDELNELEEGLEQGFESLAIGGRLAVISFHSLEHRLVRNVIHSWIRPAAPRGLPIRDEQPKARHFAKNVRPSYTERQSNSSSRSAMMQVVERLR